MLFQVLENQKSQVGFSAPEKVESRRPGGKSHALIAWAGACLVGLFPVFCQAADELIWREVTPDNLVFMELNEGQVTIELNPRFAPETVAQFRRLVQERFYDGLSFYRVIDGFVAQGGDGSDLGELSMVPLIDAEFETELAADLAFTVAQKDEMFAPETGFVDGFPVARDPALKKAWITHCPGIVAMARNDSENSSRTDFYIVFGQAPRYLDRNMNVFGRVIHGMEVVQRIQRGAESNNGIIQDEAASSRIRSMQLAADVPEDKRLSAVVMDTTSKGFGNLLKERRKRKQSFFYNQPPEVLDVCQVPMSGRVTR
jgi:peptidylprolyl isomerase